MMKKEVFIHPITAQKLIAITNNNISAIEQGKVKYNPENIDELGNFLGVQLILIELLEYDDTIYEIYDSREIGRWMSCDLWENRSYTLRNDPYNSNILPNEEFIKSIDMSLCINKEQNQKYSAIPNSGLECTGLPFNKINKYNITCPDNDPHNMDMENWRFFINLIPNNNNTTTQSYVWKIDITDLSTPFLESKISLNSIASDKIDIENKNECIKYGFNECCSLNNFCDDNKKQCYYTYGDECCVSNDWCDDPEEKCAYYNYGNECCIYNDWCEDPEKKCAYYNSGDECCLDNNWCDIPEKKCVYLNGTECCDYNDWCDSENYNSGNYNSGNFWYNYNYYNHNYLPYGNHMPRWRIPGFINHSSTLPTIE